MAPADEDATPASVGAGVPGYDATAKSLHWLIALIVIGLLAVGLYMTRMAGPLTTKFELYQLHKSFGLTVLALMLLRVAWRATHAPPPLPAAMSKLERAAAHLAHLLLYTLLIALPVTGWLMVSSAAFVVPTKLFGIIPVPHLEALAKLPAAERKPYEELFKTLHWASAYALIGLVVVHVAAALRHRLVLKDDVLARMLPGRGRRTVAAIVLTLGAGLVLAAARAEAQAPSWKVDGAKSAITFRASGGGQQVEGRFARFEVRIALDPDKPEAAAIEAKIDLASASTGQKDVDQMLVDDVWLGAKRAPLAVYMATRGERLPDGRLQLAGELTLKGATKSIAVPFKIAISGSRARAEASLDLDRIAFGVGPDGPIAGMTIDRIVKLTIVIEAERG
jgi:cytochrome b561